MRLRKDFLILPIFLIFIFGFLGVVSAAITSIDVISPTAGEYIKGDYDIEWIAEGTTGDYVDIVLGDGEWNVIKAFRVYDDSPFQWDTASVIDGSYTILIRDSTNWGENDLSGSFIIDNTNPIVTIDSVTTPTNIDTQEITGTFTETSIETITVNGIEATLGVGTYSAAISLTEEGANTITVIATDFAGNMGEASDTIILDTTEPTTDLTPESPTNPTVYESAMEIELTCDDENGCEEVGYYLSDTCSENIEDYIITPDSSTFFDISSPTNICIYAKDNVGNGYFSTSPVYYDNIYTSIQEAITDAENGDLIQISPGTYAETLNLLGKSLTIEGAGIDTTIIDASSLTGLAMQNFGSSSIIKDLTLKGTTNDYGFKVSHVSDIALENIKVENSGKTGIDLNTVNGAILTNIEIINTIGGFGLMILDSNNVEVTDITTSGNPWGGVSVHAVNADADTITFSGTFGVLEDIPLLLEKDFPYTGAFINVDIPDKFDYVVYGLRKDHDYMQWFYQETLEDAKTLAQTLMGGWTYEDMIIYDIAEENYYVIEEMLIQDAIGAASEEDTINVESGEYAGAIVNKNVKIIGAEDGTSIITSGVSHKVGSSYYTAFRPETDGAEIREFTINCDIENDLDFGVYAVEVNDITVDSLTIKDTLQGISNWGGSDWVITNNIITDTVASGGGGIGIFIGAKAQQQCVGNLVQYNEIDATATAESYSTPGIALTLDTRYGQYDSLDGTENVSENQILNNTILASGANNGVGIEVGTILGDSEDDPDRDNPEKIDALMASAAVHNNLVEGNVIDGAETGIYFYIVTDLTITQNEVKNSVENGIYIESAHSNVIIQYNHFIDNNYQVLDDTETLLNAEYNWWGTFDEEVISGLVSENVDYDPWAEDDSLTRFYAPVLGEIGDKEVDEGDTLTITLSASDGDEDTLTYSKNDGSVGTLEDNVFTWITTGADEGSHEVIFSVSDGDLTDFETITITISNVPPIVDAGPDQVADEGGAVSFSGSATDVPEDVLTYSWDFDDGDTSTEQEPTHTYADEGTGEYAVTFSVYDGTETITDELIVIVNNAVPVVEAGADQDVLVGGEVTISPTFTDDGSEDTHTTEVNWGDGTINSLTTHIYANNGEYTVTVTVTDNDEDSGSDTLTVTVSDLVLKLGSGWNLISVPKTLVDNALFGTEVWVYDTLGNSWDTPTGIDPGIGYWVQSSGEEVPINYQECGLPGGCLPSETRTFYTGWNLIGHMSMEASTQDVYDAIGYVFKDNVNQAFLLRYNGASFEVNNLETEDQESYLFKDMTPGEGYWLYTSEEITYTN